MSEFQKSILRNKLRQAEQKLGFNFDESLEEEGGDEYNNGTEENGVGSDHSLSTKKSSTDSFLEDEKVRLDWSDVFDNNDIYCNSEGYCFQTYFKKPVMQDNDSDESPVIFIGHHGAGSSGLTFADLAHCIAQKSKSLHYFTTPGFFTFDMRGHGNTNLINRNNEKLNSMNYNLSIDQLQQDFVFVFNHFMKRYLNSNPNFANSNKAKCSIFFLGHSLGGAVLTKVIYKNTRKMENAPAEFQLDPQYTTFLKGLTMVDIVEDTAIRALDSMDSYLSSIPQSFDSLQAAIDWHVSHKLVFNKHSCRYSIPSILTPIDNNHSGYKFIIDLSKTDKYWKNWFTGLSNEFISIPSSISKLLVLANNDLLDKNLIIGQMQGKYQLIVFRSSDLNLENIMTTTTTTISLKDCKQVSHFLQEDIPNKFAVSLLEYVERNDNGSFHKEESNPQLELINRLNKKWNVKK